jgi:putative Holliday junction resolvase
MIGDFGLKVESDPEPAGVPPVVQSATSNLQSKMGRLLAVDTGAVRVGLAVCDPDRTVASPLETYTRRSAEKDAAFFARLVKEERIVGLVVGLPVHMNGDEGVKAKEARAYGAWLTTVTGLPVAYHDERCTTAAAEDMLWAAGLTHKQRKARRDKLAATLILQGYLDVG